MMKDDFPRNVVSSEVRRRMIEIARGFRKEPTAGEKILWDALRGKKLMGIKFRRQQPIGFFAVDFYCSAYRLVVEVDGRSCSAGDLGNFRIGRGWNTVGNF
jgi:very-short-patch-repair endonuclease